MHKNNSTLRRLCVYPVLISMLGSAVPAHAGMIDNSQILQQHQEVQQRDTLRQALARDDVRAALLAQGVDPSVVDSRVDRLSSSELQQINAGLAGLPAGADSGVGLVLGIIFIFIVLDLLGATDVFPRI